MLKRKQDCFIYIQVRFLQTFPSVQKPPLVTVLLQVLSELPQKLLSRKDYKRKTATVGQMFNLGLKQ